MAAFIDFQVSIKIIRNFLSFVIGWMHTTKALRAVILFLFFYTEFLSYWTLPWTWFELPTCPAPHCKKLLFVSDPQIVGPEWGWFFPMDLIAIWDSDRFLKRTFRSAVDHLKPDIVVFMGDLMDQGHVATDPEFRSYLKRLKTIFGAPILTQGTKVVLIPGDNDIGGIEDILEPEYVRRFDKTFNQTKECTVTEFIEFCKVNLMTMTLQRSKFINGDLVRVVLTHVPLISRHNYFLNEVVKNIRPNVIFSGHIHKSYHYAASEMDLWSYKHAEISPSDTKPKMYKFHEGLLHEIIIPTCSYRMGVFNIGYGAAALDTEKRLVHYNVLWLPHRFVQIGFNFVLLVVFIFLCFCGRIKKNRLRKLSRSFTKHYASVP